MTANSKQIQYEQAEMDYFAYPKGYAEDILTSRNQYSKLRETNLRNLLYLGALYSFPTDNKFTLSKDQILLKKYILRDIILYYTTFS